VDRDRPVSVSWLPYGIMGIRRARDASLEVLLTAWTKRREHADGPLQWERPRSRRIREPAERAHPCAAVSDNPSSGLN
jgi:hypothetical protein